MNCKQFNTIPLEEVLLSLGHLPTKQNEKEAWYLNPFATESQASFKINKRLNYWYLFSEGIGGNNTDFMKKYLNASVNEILIWAADQNFSSFLNQNISDQKFENLSKNYEILDVKKIQHPALLEYLRERKVGNQTQFLHEIHYRMKDKNYFGIGFKNDSGGFELRNAFYKGSLLKKDVSLIDLSSNGQGKSNIQDRDAGGVAVFEGFMDALSFIELQKSFAGDILVMNSIALLNKSVDHLKNYPDIHLFLDNDNAGIKCRSEIIKFFPEAKDHSGIYSNHKDLNEFLIHRMKNNISYKAGKQSEKFPEQDRQQFRNQEPKIKNSNDFKRKR